MTSTSFFYRWYTVFVVVLVLAFAVTPTALASSGTMLVSTNTTLTEDHYGNVLVTNSNVTLDCAGHVVFGPGVPGFNGGINVDVGLDRVTVKRCGVTAFNVNGIYHAPGATDCR